MKTRRRLFGINGTAILLISLMLPLLGCKNDYSPKNKPVDAKPVEAKHDEINLNDTKLSTIPEDYQVDTVVFSRDGRQVFYKAKKKGREFLVVESSTGSDNLGPKYDYVSFLIAGPDGKRFAFGGQQRGKKRLVVDNKELKYLHNEEIAPMAFSPDGRLVVCTVGDKDKWFISISDGEKEVYRSRAYYDSYSPPAFSPDGRLLGYILTEEDKKKIVFFLDVAAGNIIKELDCVDCERLGFFSFNSDSSRVIYDVQKQGRNLIVLIDFTEGTEREIELPYALAGRLNLSPDGKKISYIGIKKEDHFLVVSPWETPSQGNVNGPYVGVVPPVFSPDSSTNAYLAMKEGNWQSVVGDKDGVKYVVVGSEPPAFSPDGARIAYAAGKGGHKGERGVVGAKWFMVVSPVDRPDSVTEGPVYDMVVTPVWSPDGKYLAYRARTGPLENPKRFIVIADPGSGKVIKVGSINEEVWPPVWNRDSRTIGYGVRNSEELWWKVETISTEDEGN